MYNNNIRPPLIIIVVCFDFHKKRSHLLKLSRIKFIQNNSNTYNY